jgi:hypothetical protein
MVGDDDGSLEGTLLGAGDCVGRGDIVGCRVRLRDFRVFAFVDAVS